MKFKDQHMLPWQKSGKVQILYFLTFCFKISPYAEYGRKVTQSEKERTTFCSFLQLPVSHPTVHNQLAPPLAVKTVGVLI